MEVIKNKYLKGSSVIEMAYIMPLFLALFTVLIHTVFYYHDKAVLNGAAAETAVLGAQQERNPISEYEPEQFFYDRIRGKLIYMDNIKVSASSEESTITVIASAQRSFMRMQICQKAVVARPEKRIRQREKIT